MRYRMIAVLAGMMALTAQAAQAEAPYCREYTKNVHVGGKHQTGYGTACMQPDGDWEIVRIAEPRRAQDHLRVPVRDDYYPEERGYSRNRSQFIFSLGTHGFGLGHRFYHDDDYYRDSKRHRRLEKKLRKAERKYHKAKRRLHRHYDRHYDRDDYRASKKHRKLKRKVREARRDYHTLKKRERRHREHAYNW